MPKIILKIMKTKIQNLIKQARRERDYSKLSAYQSILSAIQSREATENVSLTDDQIYSVIEKEMKIFEESADLFADKDRLQSATYRIKAQFCADLLPEKIDESEYDRIVSESFQKVGAESVRDMGKVMGVLTKEYGKKLDMGKISAMVKEKLS